jgi:murein DD-endopeptidase MepM/ murein hydrolase activator NlpD
MKIENIVMIGSILLCFMFAVRFNMETKLQDKERKIEALKEQIEIKENQIADLEDQLIVPVFYHPLNKTVITSSTGLRQNPMGGGDEKFHKGKDYSATIGTPVFAVLDGEVIANWLPPGYHNGILYKGHDIFGCYIILKHSENLYSHYGHNSKTFVHEGDFVKAGEKIAEVGNTGISTGPHLHFEITVDPIYFLEHQR